MRSALVLALVLAAMVPARADAPYDLYAAGHYEEAVHAALSENDAGGYALAARATLAEEVARDKPCLTCLIEAEDYAKRAIALDPKLPDAQVYFALSLGLEAHIRGPDAARALDYPSLSKHAIDAALAADPKNAMALAARGGWNLAIVHGGGALLAALFYGASLHRGLEDFNAAMTAAPANIAVRYQYALSLSTFDRGRFQGQIETVLADTLRIPATTAYQRLVHSRAGELLALLKKGETAAYDAEVRKFEGYPPTDSPR